MAARRRPIGTVAVVRVWSAPHAVVDREARPAPVAVTRDAAAAPAITVDGLVIEGPAMPHLPASCRKAIIGGPRAFVIRAEDRKTFAEAILGKGIPEIARAGDDAYRPLKSGLRFSAKALMPSR